MQNLERAIKCLENVEATSKRTEKKDLLLRANKERKRLLPNTDP